MLAALLDVAASPDARASLEDVCPFLAEVPREASPGEATL
jgi:hypothetical protein